MQGRCRVFKVEVDTSLNCMYYVIGVAGLAHLVEQRICNPLVGGSSPSAGTNISTVEL